jgi:hypothetical protein
VEPDVRRAQATGRRSGGVGGNGGTLERAEKQKQLSRPFHNPLEISQKARDFHIPTARLRGHGKEENQKPVSLFPTAARDGDPISLYPSPKTEKGSRPLGGLPPSHFHDHLVLETKPDFMIILRLENAPAVTSVRPHTEAGALTLTF